MSQAVASYLCVALGVVLSEVYGATETGAATATLRGTLAPGHVGIVRVGGCAWRVCGTQNFV